MKAKFERKWVNYYAEETCLMGEYTFGVTHKLNFISYWLIYLIHGPEKLDEIANNYLLDAKIKS